MSSPEICLYDIALVKVDLITLQKMYVMTHMLEVLHNVGELPYSRCTQIIGQYFQPTTLVGISLI